MKILVVDDDLITLKAVEKYLTGDGHQITTSVDGYEALKILEKERYDLLIADIAMPRLSGFELLKFLKGKLNNQMPVILMSAFQQKTIITNAFQLGANNFMNKPLNLDELSFRISEFCQTT